MQKRERRKNRFECHQKFDCRIIKKHVFNWTTFFVGVAYGGGGKEEEERGDWMGCKMRNRGVKVWFIMKIKSIFSFLWETGILWQDGISENLLTATRETIRWWKRGWGWGYGGCVHERGVRNKMETSWKNLLSKENPISVFMTSPPSF